MTPMFRAKTLRDLLVTLGIGHFNATMVIPIMFTQPATTDPKQPGVIHLVRALQANLHRRGFDVDSTGYLDSKTTAALDELYGSGEWVNLTWADVTNRVLSAQRMYQIPAPAGTDVLPEPVGAFDFLPDVPGGALTYVAGAGLLYYLWKKRKR